MAALPQYQPRRLEPKLLHRLGRRLSRLGSEGSADLARIAMRRIRQLPHGQGGVEVARGIGQGMLDARPLEPRS
jgi:hypothetical protein